jgi:hypothetical protein
MASLFNPQFQIISDLHLETPFQQPSYRSFHLNLAASYLMLLGDIGLVTDPGLFTFLEGLLKRTPNLTIFYVLGNHEPYQITLEDAHSTMLTFSEKMTMVYGPRLIVMNRTRHDISPTITVLGCTLWTEIANEHASEICNVLTDFNTSRGIRNWSLESHLDEHRKDLAWLNEQVSKIEQEQPERQIIILTHHSPTTDSRVNDPRHKDSPINSGFVNDLSKEICWTSPTVCLWAFGHTHYSAHYHEGETGKLVFSNQRGYTSLGAIKQPSIKCTLVEASENRWRVIESREKQHSKSSKTSNQPKDNAVNPSPPKSTKNFIPGVLR